MNVSEVNANLIHCFVGGSNLYGTNTPNSDIDLRGVCLEPENCLLGLAEFQQYESKEPHDTVIYSLRKFCKLALNCNPNIMDILFCPPERWLIKSAYWGMIYENRYLFLSQKIKQNFMGFADSLQRDANLNVPPYYKPKPAAHWLRTLYQIRNILLHNDYNPILQKDELAIVKAVINSQLTVHQVLRIANDLRTFINHIPDQLPVEPDRAKIEEILIYIQRDYLLRKGTLQYAYQPSPVALCGQNNLLPL